MFELLIDLVKGPHGSLVVTGLIIASGFMLSVPSAIPRRKSKYEYKRYVKRPVVKSPLWR